MDANRLPVVLLACLAAALAGPAGAPAPPRPRLDIHGDPLPPGAIARLGKSSGEGEALGTVTFLPDGALLSVNGRVVRRWDARTGKLLSTRKVRDHVLAVAPDGNLLFAKSKGDVWLGGRGGEKVIRTFKGHAEYLRAVIFSPDGKRMATASGHQTLRLWDVASGKEIRRLSRDDPRRRQFIDPLGFTPDGKKLVYAEMTAAESRLRYDPLTGMYIGEIGIDSVRVLDASDGKELYHFRTSMKGARFCSVEENLIAFRQEKPRGVPSLYLLRPTAAREVRPIVLRPAMDSNEFALSPDHRYVACRINRTEVALFEAASGKEIRRFPGRDRADGPANLYCYPCPSLAFSPDGRRLFCLSDDGTGFIWDVTGRAREGPLRPAAPSPRELEALWQDLASADARTAHRATWTLAAAPRAAVLLLGRHLGRPRESSRRLTRLIDDLGSEEYETREKATTALAKLGEEAGFLLEQTLARKPDLEVHRRVERLLSCLSGPLTDPEGLREVRAVHVLEQIGTPEARVLLRRLEGNAAGSRLGIEAKAALQRLARRPAPKR